MKLAASNIGWEAEQDNIVYSMLAKHGFTGLEIAPTRIFPEKPYEKLVMAKEWAKRVYEMYGLQICSMQSIWFGRNERLFGSESERDELLEYTKRAVDFARIIGCHNLVFGCPRNRIVPDGVNDDIAVDFFRMLGEYAINNDTVIGMEANPTIYNTNYINTTKQALELIEQVNSKGFCLNLDVGTMLQNRENIDELDDKGRWINHVHISEPGLKAIQHRKVHKELKVKLFREKYKGFISIEMARRDDLACLESSIRYVKELFENDI